MEELSDEELIGRYRAAGGAAAGDSFINQLFQRHHSRVAGWCLRMTGDVNSAADLAQEIFIKAFQRLDSFRGESKFTTWLYAIARNQCMDELRVRAMHPEKSSDAGLDEVEDLRLEDLDASIDRRDQEEILRQVMRDSLDAVETEVMTLHYVHEMPLDAITRLLHLNNPSGAKAHIVNARRKLNRALERWKSRGKPLTGRAYDG